MSSASVWIILACCVAFTGCVLKGPEVRVKPPIEIKVEDDKGGGKFCPPGQAKKGRC